MAQNHDFKEINFIEPSSTIIYIYLNIIFELNYCYPVPSANGIICELNYFYPAPSASGTIFK